MAKRNTKRKRIKAWAVVGKDGASYSMDTRAKAVAVRAEWDVLYEDLAPHRVAPLREVTPAEEAVLRAARSKAHDADLRLSRAIERMEKER